MEHTPDAIQTNKVKALRASYGVTQEPFAIFMGWSVATLVDVELGRKDYSRREWKRMKVAARELASGRAAE